MTKELNIAIKAALEAGKIQLEGCGAALDVEIKGDNSPVTQFDKRCEEKIREIILSEFPDDGFLGEESGESGPPGGRRWIVDPIDGTRPFIRGIPTHSALIALEVAGEPAIGVINVPAMGVVCHASKGGGAFLNDKKIRVSSVKKLSNAMGCGLGMIQRAGKPEGRCLDKYLQSLDYAYGFMDAYTYVLIACGKLDACVNLLDKPWDCAAAACIVTEAGGRFSAVNGEKTIHGGSFVLTNGILHDEVLEFFRDGGK
jgi:histidinol phosphatase-like enzyme (inositol monophosphatase family)